MQIENKTLSKEKLTQYAPIAGSILIISGLILLLDQRLQTHWLSISIPVFVSIALIIFGSIKKRVWWSVTGLIFFGLGTALFLLLLPTLQWKINLRVGYSLFAQGFVWLLIFILLWICRRKTSWWPLFVSAVCLALSYIFISNRKALLDFIFFLSLAVGIVLLAWGLERRKLALILPGVIISTVGAGVYFGWSNPESPGGLQKTGVMLVWFAFGWVMITVLSRIIDKRFIWWPLIPGGILLMVGSGLYIGGNPENALGFLGNTGSIGLILIGIYLIFLKFGMKR